MRLGHGLEQKPGLTVKPTESQVLLAQLLAIPIVNLSREMRHMAEDNPCINIEEIPDDTVSIESARKEEPLPDLSKLGSAHILRYASSSNDDDDREEQYEAPKVSFWSYLDSQFETVFPDGDERREIARRIIDSLDDDGLLRIPPAQLAEELKRPVKELEKVRKVILQFDPPGVGALDARELCLAQLEDHGLRDGSAYKLVKRHWKLLNEKGPLDAMHALGYSEERIEEVVGSFRWLYVSPRDMYGESKPSYVFPEVIIKLVEDEFVVEMVERGLPRISVNRVAQKALKDPDIPADQKQVLREKMRRALDFFRALEERKTNIRRVAEFVVEYQEDFLRGRALHIDPITQTEAAEKLGLHISTLNRVVKGRWADTPVGVYELRTFFAKGVETQNGQISHKFLMDKVKALVEGENKRNPLTDQEIVDHLKEKEGIRLSRRSITEYRQRLGIPRRSKRRVRS
jgi:RNA polymerase sigma-54 factor